MTAGDVRLDGLKVGFGRTDVAGPFDVSLSGAALTLMTGPNGCGKTTLLRTIAGLRRPRAGSVVLPEGAVVAYVPQVHAIDEGLPVTAREVVSLGASPRLRLPRAGADAALARVGVEGLGRRRFSRLSGGQARRVLVARALACDATVVLLDEPSAGIDVEAAEPLWELFGGLAAEGRCVVAVTHDLARARRVADGELDVGRRSTASHG